MMTKKAGFLRSCTYPYNPGFSQKQRNKATVFFLAFLGKIRTLGLVLCVNFTSIFIGARCEFPDFGLSEFLSTNIFQLAVRGWLIAFSIAFQWLIEISLLLTGLLGPLAVGGSLLPVGQKAIFAWVTGFFSVGMVKLSFNIICGLVATLVLNADANDPLIFAFATGLLAPILSLILAAGAGMAVFNSLSSVATFGLSKLFTSKIF